MKRLVFSLALALCSASALQGCMVLAVVDTVGSAAIKTAGAVAGVAADVAVGTVKLTGKVVGAAADAVVPDGEVKK